MLLRESVCFYLNIITIERKCQYFFSLFRDFFGGLMTIGERLKHWRKNNNLKTTDISKATGLSTGGLSEYENDKKLIGTKTILSLYREYNIDINWLLTGKEGETEKLTENEKELLTLFRELSERSQVKILGIVEDRYKEELSEDVKSSTSKIG